MLQKAIKVIAKSLAVVFAVVFIFFPQIIPSSLLVSYAPQRVSGVILFICILLFALWMECREENYKMQGGLSSQGHEIRRLEQELMQQAYDKAKSGTVRPTSLSIEVPAILTEKTGAIEKLQNLVDGWVREQICSRGSQIPPSNPPR